MARMSGPATKRPTSANDPSAMSNIIDMKRPLEWAIERRTSFHSAVLPRLG